MGMLSKNVGRVAAGALALAAVETAKASLIIDFQFDSTGTISKNIGLSNVGNTVTVQVWGTVSIGPSDSGLVGISSAGFRALSQQIGGGAFTTFGATSFAPTTNFNNVSTKGQTLDVNGDGLRDLGVASGVLSTNDAKARALGSPLTPAAPGYYSDEGGWTVTATQAKIQLGIFKVVIGTLGAGTTQYNVALPQNVSGASWFENVNSADNLPAPVDGGPDGIPDGEDGTNNTSPITGSYLTGTSVSFVVTGSATYKYALTTHNNATLGTLNTKSLTVTGSNGNYFDPGPPTNYAPADGTKASYTVANASLGVGPEVAVLVMVEFDLGSSGLTQATLEGKLASAGNGSVSPDTGTPVIVGLGDSDPLSQYNLLLGQYPSFINDATHVTLLFEYNSVNNTVSNGLAFGFDLTGSNVSVLRTIIVPEPASLGLLSLGGLGLLKRRRR